MKTTKNCKYCWKEFQMYATTDKFCKASCMNKAKVEKEKKNREKEREKKSISITVLKTKLWKIISEYIRRKYANTDWNTSCVTCPTTKPWSELQAGHFCPSGSSSYLRYVESNIHPQCYRCNINLWSNPIEYREFMIRTYWEKFVEQMLSLRSESISLKSFDLQLLIEKYKEKLENLPN